MSTAVIALLLVASSPAKTWSLDTAASTVRYHVVHKLHRVQGVTKALEGKAVLQADGKILAMVRAPVASFDSGDRNRDAHMQETLESARHPYVVFKGVASLDGPQHATQGTTTAQLPMTGELELHGVRNPVSVPLTVEFRADGTARARGSFEVSLESFRIQRPSLLFVKIDDGCRIEVDLALRETTP